MFDIGTVAEHWFWWLMTVAVLVWYSTVTVYVAVRGALDIRNMLKRLSGAVAGEPPQGLGGTGHGEEGKTGD